MSVKLIAVDMDGSFLSVRKPITARVFWRSTRA